MEEQRSPSTTLGEPSGEELARELAQEWGLRRAQALDRLHERNGQIRDLGGRLAGQLEGIVADLDDGPRAEELQRREEEIAGKTERLERLKTELDELQAAFSEAQEDLRRKHAERQERLAERDAALRQGQSELAQRRRELDGRQAQLDAALEKSERLQTELEERRKRFGTQSQELSEEWQRLKRQRKRVAEQFKQQRAAREDELRRLREELEQTGQQSGDAEEAESWRRRAEEFQGELERLRDENARLRSDADAGQSSQEEIGRLRAQIEELEAAPQRAGDRDGDDDDELEDLRERYEMALEDLKAERRRVAHLEEAAAASGGRGGGSGGKLDWEEQKRRLLASLESDFDEGDEEDDRDRMTVEDYLRKTDEAVAAKEREIVRLEQLLEEQAAASDFSDGQQSHALTEALDADERIRQERERLQTMQQEWREKLRQAEVDVSMERAQIARERAELQEKSRELQQRLLRLENQTETAAGGAKGGKNQRNWLARLGLKEDEG